MNYKTAQILCSLLEKNQTFFQATLLEVKGSAPQEIGAKIIVAENTVVAGTIGGGKIEARVIQEGMRSLTEGKQSNCLVRWNLQKDIGMTCGGEVTILFEYFRGAPWNIAIFGAGHVAQALVRVLLPLNSNINLFDHRPEWIAKLPGSWNFKVKCTQEPVLEFSTLAPNTFVIVLTQGHATDLPILKAAMSWNRYGYLGVLGSTVKAGKVRAELLTEGFSAEQVERLHCPMGMDFGSNLPEEIAISIAAQLLKIRDEAIKSHEH